MNEPASYKNWYKFRDSAAEERDRQRKGKEQYSKSASRRLQFDNIVVSDLVMFPDSFDENDDVPTIRPSFPTAVQEKKRPTYMEVVGTSNKQQDDPFRLSSSSDEKDAPTTSSTSRSKQLKRKVSKKKKILKLPKAAIQQPSLSPVKAPWISRKRSLNASPSSPMTSAIGSAVKRPPEKRVCDQVTDPLSDDQNENECNMVGQLFAEDVTDQSDNLRVNLDTADRQTPTGPPDTSVTDSGYDGGGDVGLRSFVDDLFDSASPSSSSDEGDMSDDLSKCNLIDM